TRFGSPKQRLLLGPVLERVRAARSLGEIVVVLGAHEVETDARVVRCRDWEVGAGASLRCGLAALSPEAEAAIVVLAEGPGLAAARLHRQLTVDEAARRAGLTPDEVEWLEAGRVYRFPSADAALVATLLYASALGIDHREARILAGLPVAPRPHETVARGRRL